MIATCSSQLCGRMDVDLDHARVGRHLDHVEPRIGRRRVAFEQHRQVELGRGVFDRGHELEEFLGTLGRRHEDAELAVARLDRQGGPDGAQLLAGCAPRRRLAVPRCRCLAAASAGAPAVPRAPRTDRAARRCRAGPAAPRSGSRAAGGSRPANRREPGTACRAGFPTRSLRQCDRPLACQRWIGST